MRLYRGLTRPCKPRKVAPRELKIDAESNFTDCPYIALEFARGSKGIVLVIDVPPQPEERVHEAMWLRTTAKRFIVYGPFEDFLIATLPAKDLRAELRSMGMSRFSAIDVDRSLTLRGLIRRKLQGARARAELRHLPERVRA